MSDSTGSRDNLRIESSRCLPIRFNESSCSRCVDSCPHNAIFLEDRLIVDRELCTGCLLCTTVCPSGALEMDQDFDVCLAKLAKATDPVFGCVRSADSANTVLPCLGGLASEHLLALYHSLSLSGIVTTLNISMCGECPNGAILKTLKERLQNISDAGMDRGGCRILQIDSVGKITVHHESIGRRSFFKSLRSTLFQSAAIVISGTTEHAGQRSDYAEKRVPLRRMLLNRTINGMTPDLQGVVRSHYDSYISFSEACTACQGCAAICPTGALLTENPGNHPLFIPERCTGCGLCREFCLDDALEIV
ncbi:MAG: 4Fe-4S binding protein [Geobacteraceae bacterium]|nr:4Fe-4S binding protein [Geobacteraceae bacterium]NTW78900.1 4Fe-4S binding protein [Geobacteraceae bacterium]